MSAGDVYTYNPENHHCMEGLAVENERGRIIDWFWGGDVVGNQVIDIIDPKVTDLEKIANLNDYELTPRNGRESNADYAPEDRLVLTAQHGLQRTYYIRIGAKPDLATQIENAEYALEEAKSEARSAQYRVERASEALAKLKATS